MIDRKDLELFHYADDPAQALLLLQNTLQTEPEQAGPGPANNEGNPKGAVETPGGRAP